MDNINKKRKREYYGTNIMPKMWQSEHHISKRADRQYWSWNKQSGNSDRKRPQLPVLASDRLVVEIDLFSDDWLVVESAFQASQSWWNQCTCQ